MKNNKLSALLWLFLLKSLHDLFGNENHVSSFNFMFVSPGEGLLAKEIRRGILTFCVCIVSKGHILAFWSEIG